VSAGGFHGVKLLKSPFEFNQHDISNELRNMTFLMSYNMQIKLTIYVGITRPQPIFIPSFRKNRTDIQ